MALANLFDRLLDTSVTLNGIAIPGRSVEKTIAQYVTNVFVFEDNDQFPVSLKGSGITLCSKEHNFLICTQHQLKGVDREKVSIPLEGGATLITSAGMSCYNQSSETDAFDLVAFDFTEASRTNTNLRAKFLKVNKHRPTRMEIITVILIGYAFCDQIYDVAENKHISVTARKIICRTDHSLPSDNAIIRVIPMEPLTFDPNGMSGGAAFMVIEGPSGFELAFAGVIVRGGKESFYIIKGGLVLDFLESVASKKI